MDLISRMFFFNIDSTGVKVLGTATALVGKSSALSTLNALGTFTAELYPTVVR